MNIDNENQLQQIKKNKSKMPLIIIINIIVIIAITGGIYYYFNTKVKDSINSDNNQINKETEPEKLDLNIPSSEELETLISKYEFQLTTNTTNIPNIPNTTSTSLIYLDNNITIDNIDRRIIDRTAVLFMGFDIDGCNSNDAGKTFTLNEYEESVAKLFGEKKSKQLKPENISSPYGIDKNVYIYDEKTKEYLYQMIDGCGTKTISQNNKEERKIFNSKIEGNQLKVEVAVGLSFEPTGNLAEDVKPGRIGYNISPYDNHDYIEGFDLERDYDKLTKFTYTFDYDKETGYYFNNIIRN